MAIDSDKDFQVYKNTRIAELDLRKYKIYILDGPLWRKASAEWIKSFRRDAFNEYKPIYFVYAYFNPFDNRVYVKPYKPHLSYS